MDGLNNEVYFLKSWWQFLIMAVVCYLIGCINFAQIIARYKNRDIRKIGSGNPGTMNMSREFGWKIGVLTFFGDALKGGVPALISYFLYRNKVFAGTDIIVSDFTRYFCGIWVIIGHIFPATMGFKGGKGIASTLGLFWFNIGADGDIFHYWFLLIGFGLLLCIVLFIYLTEWGAMGSLIGVTTFSIWQGVMFIARYGTRFNAYLVCLFVAILVINLLTWIAHRKNIMRLLAGEEHRTSVKNLVKKK
jgi:glycerol-3-phosphate acyltransferase PlsY